MPLQFDIGYIKSPVGLLKIGEIFCLLIAFACLSNSNDRTGELGGRYDFFMFVTVTLWLLVFLLFALFVTQFHQNINLPWVPTMLVTSIVACLMLLLASSLIADKLSYLHRSPVKYIGHYRPACQLISCGNVTGAVLFGFFSLFLFVADTVFYYIKFRGPPPGAENLSEPDPYRDPEDNFDNFDRPEQLP